MPEKGNTCTLLVGCKLAQSLWKTEQFPQGNKNRTTIFPSNLTSRYICKGNRTTTLKRYQFFHVCCCAVCSVMPTLCDPVDCSPPGSSVPWNFSGKNTGAGCHFLLQEIFLIQGVNPHLLCLLHWQVDSLSLCYQSFFNTPMFTIVLFTIIKVWE